MNAGKWTPQPQVQYVLCYMNEGVGTSALANIRSKLYVKIYHVIFCNLISFRVKLKGEVGQHKDIYALPLFSYYCCPVNCDTTKFA